MDEAIRDSLKGLEEQEDIKILFACEAGSRIWKTHSESSDYDVRFIYIRNLQWYLQIYEERDVIEAKKTKSLELVGWDLKKAIRLLYKSNPTLLEWINSPIIYQYEPVFTKKLKTLSSVAFSLPAAVHHYLNMARKNYQTLLNKQTFTPKKYLTVLRPILTCLYLIDKKEMPKSDLLSLVHFYIKRDDLHKELEDLVQKRQGNHQYFESPLLIDYFEQTMIWIDEELTLLTSYKNKKQSIHPFNQFFLDTLLSN